VVGGTPGGGPAANLEAVAVISRGQPLCRQQAPISPLAAADHHDQHFGCLAAVALAVPHQVKTTLGKCERHAGIATRLQARCKITEVVEAAAPKPACAPPLVLAQLTAECARFTASARRVTCSATATNTRSCSSVFLSSARSGEKAVIHQTRRLVPAEY
jgi:hypothetical protein